MFKLVIKITLCIICVDLVRTKIYCADLSHYEVPILYYIVDIIIVC